MMMNLHLDIYLPVMASVVLHEIAHGYAAYFLGDPTAKEAGRLTLNPLRHMRVVGSFALPLGLLVLSGGKFLFGWARPLPVEADRLEIDHISGMALVAWAGPMMNMQLAWLCWIAGGLLDIMGVGATVRPWLSTGLAVNCFLAVFNLLPVKPLDGWHMLRYLRRKKSQRETGNGRL